MRLSNVKEFLRANAVILLIGFVIGTGIGMIETARSHPSYTATATILPSMGGDQGDTGALSQVQLLTSRVPEYAAVVQTESFLKRVVAENDLDIDATELGKRTVVGSPKGTSLLTLSVTGRTSGASIRYANAVASTMKRVIPERESLLPVHVTITEPASTATTSSNKGSWMDILKYSYAAVLVAFGISIIRSYVPRTVSAGEARPGKVEV